MVFLQLGRCPHFRGVTENGSYYSCSFALITQYIFPKSLYQFNAFHPYIRKRVLWRLRECFRGLTLNEKKLESTSNTAGVSPDSHFSSLWEIPRAPAGTLFFAFSAPFHRSHCSTTTKETHLFYLRVSDQEIISTIYWGSRGIGFFADLNMQNLECFFTWLLWFLAII